MFSRRVQKEALARGVTDYQQRQKLIDTAFAHLDEHTPAAASSSQALPGAGAAWLLDSGDTVQQVRRVSARVLKLQSLFGDDSSVDIAAMLIREPRLISAEISLIARRLLEIRLMIGLDGTDVMAVVQAQPSLLIQELSTTDSQESDGARRRAWEFGLASDGDSEWLRRAGELREYVAAHGDAHVGFREQDDAELARWAAKQRKDWKSGDLAPDRRKVLEDLQFEFDGDKAEWMRWYGELQKSTDDTMLGTGRGADFYLYNWCCVQRIAKRSGVLAEERVAMLDGIGFDWTGADALS
ncbi:g3892 [Coccomyxa elongata]